MEGKENFSEKPADVVSVWKWIGIFCLNFIPVAGQIVYLILLLIWAFGSSGRQDPTFTNWARAQLIFILVLVILTASCLRLLAIFECFL